MIACRKDNDFRLASESTGSIENVQVGLRASVGKADAFEVETRTQECCEFGFLLGRSAEIQANIGDGGDQCLLDDGM